VFVNRERRSEAPAGEDRPKEPVFRQDRAAVVPFGFKLVPLGNLHPPSPDQATFTQAYRLPRAAIMHCSSHAIVDQLNRWRGIGSLPFKMR